MEINTPQELLNFMDKNINYGYLGKNKKIYHFGDINFDEEWYEEYILSSASDLLNNKVGNCWDQVEFERDWFEKRNYEFKTFYIMVDLPYNNPYPTHSYLAYKDNDKWYYFENSDFDNRGIYEFNNIDELVNFQKEKHIELLKKYNIKDEELDKLIIKEFTKPKENINAKEYIEHIMNTGIEYKKIDAVIIGNTAYDINTFLNRDGEEKKVIANKGGACLYSLIPASIFNRVGVVTKIGTDFEKELFDNNYNIDTTGLKVIDGPSNKFIHTYLSEDGQQRTFKDETNPECLLTKEDIPDEYLSAKYIHVCTNTPDTQLELVKYLKENSEAIISIDTHEEYVNDPKVLEVFNLVDIAFIDKEFKNLYDCKAKIKIFKQGKSGCHFVSDEKDFIASTVLCDNVIDKTGAGDCVTGVFLALKALNKSDEESLQKAVEVATESIKDYGMEHLLKKF